MKFQLILSYMGIIVVNNSSYMRKKTTSQKFPSALRSTFGGTALRSWAPRSEAKEGTPQSRPEEGGVVFWWLKTTNSWPKNRWDLTENMFWHSWLVLWNILEPRNFMTWLSHHIGNEKSSLTHSLHHFSEGSTTIYAVDQRLWDVGWMTGELNDWDHINQQWANGGPSSIVVLSFGMVRKRANSPWNLDHTSFYVGKTPYIISINKPSPSHHHFYRW